VEDKERSGDEADASSGVVPAQVFAEVEECEDGEDGERDDLLDHLELHGRESGSADAVGGDLEQVFKEGNAPTDEDDLPKGVLAVFQVAVPGEGHEDVGEDEKDHCQHRYVGCGRGGPGLSEYAMRLLKENLERLEESIAAACHAAGRERGEIELMAVSKTYPAATIAEAAGLGLRLFGESRVQEFAAKALALRAADLWTSGVSGDARVHLIGHLQTNKAARAAELFDGVDSLDSLRLAEKLNETAGKLGKRLPVLIEVKLSSEETKAGLEPESAEAAELLERLPEFENLEMRGLMTIAPWGVAEDLTRACFRSLRFWRDRWAGKHPSLKFDVLSMGMSGDFALAIAEGATRIRVGTALFGKRQPWTGPE